ncbi:uncharacterized protein [Rutidosis leptorrhynchoides]|uniref:uncharacterized protein n=1 Tax=Rutidosis leptorrhynchoides TaxID=125765 RepID=UPI003A9A1E43
MYADRVDTAPKNSIKDRLNIGTLENSGRRRQVTGKRQRQDDDKWEHDLYEQADPQVSNRRVGVLDLRSKLQNKGSLSGVRDLREKLSGLTNSQPAVTAPAKPKMAPNSGPIRRSVVAKVPATETRKVASTGETVDSFLQDLGLEKYSITFQAEEVDMTALLHMTDEDLKAIGIPMGPRKKILLALEAKLVVFIYQWGLGRVHQVLLLFAAFLITFLSITIPIVSQPTKVEESDGSSTVNGEKFAHFHRIFSGFHGFPFPFPFPFPAGFPGFPPGWWGRFPDRPGPGGYSGGHGKPKVHKFDESNKNSSP